ncbi:MAG: putative selenium-dependent hydroxylase accessory protein YqeC, partial [Acidimicrobiaceae bacterium]|nr:putative selenium-dependent hydroxylase accessory protein YqeC [Acidimicrobiaceae bacterium]
RCDLLFDMVDYVLVVADEARSLPFKAPGTFEPVVPSATTMMVSVIGADALGRVIADQCHRPLRVAALAQCQPYERLTPKAAAAVLLHPNGQRAALPERARLVVAITKVEATNAGLVEELRGELARLEPAVTALSLAVSG